MLIKYILLVSSISCIFLMSFMWDIYFFQFTFFYTVLFICANILEYIGSALLAKIVPSNINIGSINSGLIIIVATTLGRFVGSCLITILGLSFGIEYLQNITFIFFLIFYCVLFYFTIRNFKDLRVKAISKILKKQN
jgi:hypothetical protein